MATFTQTQKINGDILVSKVKNVVGSWKVGRFLPMTERGWSINTFALSKVWCYTHCVDLRQGEFNINKSVRQFLYNIIKRAVLEGKELGAMLGKDWYQLILKSLLEEEEGQLVPCCVELIHRLHDWTRSWALARLKGLSSETMTFLFRVLHQILPCRERLERIFPRIETCVCRVCDTGEKDSLLHSLALCPGTRKSFESGSVTTEKILLLDISASASAENFLLQKG